MKNKKLIALGTISIIIGLFTINALSGSDKDKWNKDADFINKKVNKENGQIEFKQTVKMQDYNKNEKDFVEFEDSKNTYRTEHDSNKITIARLKPDKLDYHLNRNGDLGKGQASKIARSTVDKYFDKDENIKEIIEVSNYLKKDALNNYYQIIFEAIAKNGIRTGDSFSVDISSEGEVIGYVAAKGNPSIALNDKPSITEDKAVEAAWNDLKNNITIDTKYLQKNPKISLRVFGDKLAYEITLKDFVKGDSMDAKYFIDAKTGSVIQSAVTK